MTEAFIMDSRQLYAISLDGTWRQVPGDWFGTNALARQGDKLLALFRGELMEVDPHSGAYRTISSRWGTQTHLLAVTDSRVFIGAGPKIYEARPDGDHELLTASYEGMTALVPMGERVFVLEDHRLQELYPDDGGWRVISDSWKEAFSMVSLGGKLYLAERDGDLYEVDPDTAQARIVSREWPMFHGLATLDGHLLALSGATVYEAGLDGSYQPISQGWRHMGVFAAQG
jgi:hypothetical protein